MNRIVYTRKGAPARSMVLPASPVLYVVAIALLLFTGGLGIGLISSKYTSNESPELAELRVSLEEQRAELEVARRNNEEQVNALALRLGQMNANVIRLNALGRRLTEMADLEKGEFDFDSNPAVGGVEEPVAGGVQLQLPDLVTEFDLLSAQLDDREQQLEVLENVMLGRKLQDRMLPSGRPVKSGWLSSYFGNRTDPINGKRAWHRGIDFAGKRGTEIVAVADGVVSWSRERYGYGNLVEINHGNGYVTRYAHNDSNAVKLGETVQQGQVIAYMGSTGRSTGTHLHFEVWHNGKPVNPRKFVGQ